MKTIGCIYRLVDRNIIDGLGNKEAIVEITNGIRRAITYQELYNLSCYYKNIFKESKPVKLAIIGESTIETIALWLGAMRGGHCVLLVAADQMPSHYQEIWSAYKPDYIYVDDEHLGEYGTVIPKVDNFSRMDHDYAGALQTSDDEDCFDDRPALCLRTSGSTGKSKICVHAHKNIALFEELVLKPYWKFQQSDKLLSTAGPFFSFGLQGIYTALLSGATAVTMPRRKTINQYLDVIGKEKVSIIFGVPTLFNILMERHNDNYDLGSLRLTMSAGERLPDIVRYRWESLTGSTVLDSIGTTETFTPYLTEDASEPGHLKQIDGIEYEWVNIPDDDSGDLYTVNVGSPAMMIGYYESERNSPFQNGVNILETKDLFQFKSSSIIFKSRLSEQIKVSGQWVSPQDLEEFIIKDNRVQKVCVIPVESTDGLNRLSAFIVLKKQCQKYGDLVIDDIMKSILELRPKALRPDSIYIVRDIPQTASGKLLRRSLADEFFKNNITPLNGTYLY